MISSDDFACTVTTFASEYTSLPVLVDVFCAPNLNSSTVTLPEFVPSTFDTMMVLSLNTCPEFTGLTTTLDETVVILATLDLPLIVVTATILGAAIYFSLFYTIHGPVLKVIKDKNIAVAVRCAWLEKGGAPYLASLRMNQAKSWTEFKLACSFSNIPGENMIWADRLGNIGWQTVGIAPIRRKVS